MRARYPHTEGFVDRDGVKLHYEIYGEGEHTIVFVPAWAITHFMPARCARASASVRMACASSRSPARPRR